MKYIISRFINDISLNPKEYALDDDGEIQLFTKKEALKLAGYNSIEEAEEDWIFIESVNVDREDNCIYCGQKCWLGEMCDEQQAGGF